MKTFCGTLPNCHIHFLWPIIFPIMPSCTSMCNPSLFWYELWSQRLLMVDLHYIMNTLSNYSRPQLVVVLWDHGGNICVQTFQLHNLPTFILHPQKCFTPSRTLRMNTLHHKPWFIWQFHLVYAIVLDVIAIYYIMLLFLVVEPLPSIKSP